MVAMLLLGFASGLPYLLSGDTLKLWLRDVGSDVKTIGAFALVTLPYAIKVLWAPLVDRFVPPLLGRRRGWLLGCQLAIAAVLVGIAGSRPDDGLTAVAALALALAFLSATQDVVADAWRADVLDEREAGVGVAVFVGGYRSGLLVAAALAPILAVRMPWATVYLAMAGLMVIGMVGTALAPEPAIPASPPTLSQAVVGPARDLRARLGYRLPIVLLFALTYKLGDQLAGNLAGTFLQDIGFTKDAIGAIRGGIGLAASVGGVFLGGAIIVALGIPRALWIFGALQALSNLGYLALAEIGPRHDVMAAVVVVENICGGLGTAAFLGFLLKQCDPRYSATEFALFTSLMALGGIALSAGSGALPVRYGWSTFFLVSIAASLPGLLCLIRVAPWSSPPQRG
ncbi:MAG: MFS transporter [Planctomycetes bacterium]|nr:MFS transporter [Planctomycetota bacterium]